MKLADWIAVYGALVATCVAAWQLITYWQGHRPRLVVTGKSSVFIEGEAEARIFDRALKGDGDSSQCPPFSIRLKVVNPGRVRVHLSSLVPSQADGDDGREWDLSPWAELPLWLEPGEATTFPLTQAELTSFRFTAPVEVTAGVSTGRCFKYQLPAFSVDKDSGLQIMVGMGLYDKMIKVVPPPPGSWQRHIVDREPEPEHPAT